MTAIKAAVLDVIEDAKPMTVRQALPQHGTAPYDGRR
jgi:hypothetical protein